MLGRRLARERRVATVLLRNPDSRHFTYDTARSARVRANALYRTLARWHARGWLTTVWEDGTGARPPRRYYRVTELGMIELCALLGTD